MRRMLALGVMNNGATRGSRVPKKKKRLCVQEDTEKNLDPEVILSVKIPRAEGVSTSARLYKCILWVEPGKEKTSEIVYGGPNPRWNTQANIRLKASVLTWGFLHVEVVVKLLNKVEPPGTSEPGTSKGIVSVSRGRIPLPKEMDEKIEGRFGLVKINEESGKICGGHIFLSMKLHKVVSL